MILDNNFTVDTLIVKCEVKNSSIQHSFDINLIKTIIKIKILIKITKSYLELTYENFLIITIS